MPETIQFKPGEFVILQGQPSASFYILKSGTLEVIVNGDEPAPTREEAASNGRRMSLIDRPNLPVGEIGVIADGPRSSSVRALTPVSVIELRGSRQELLNWIHQNPRAALLFTRTACLRTIATHSRWHSVRVFDKKIKTYLNNLSVLLSILNSSDYPEGSAGEKFITSGRRLISEMDRRNPPPLRNLHRDLPPADIPPPLHLPFEEMERVYFYKLLLGKPDDALEWMTSYDRLHPCEFVSKEFAEVLPRVSRNLYREMANVESGLDSFFDDDGIVAVFIDMYKKLNANERKAADPYLSELRTIISSLAEEIDQLWGDTFPNRERVDQSRELLRWVIEDEVPAAETARENDTLYEAVPVSAESAVDAAQEEKPEPNYDFPACISSIKLTDEEQNWLDTCLGKGEPAPAQVYQSYWRLYSRIWKENRSGPKRELTGFLRYGLVPGEPIRIPESFNLEPKVQGPVMYADQWLTRIYDGDSPPSRNELGLSFEEYLRSEKREFYREDSQDEKEDRLHYEIEQMLSRAARAFSGGHGELAVVRRSQEEIDEYATKLTDSGTVAETLLRLLKLDFSAFYRDVRVQLEARSEFLPREVIPFVILLPAGGERAMSWQEFEGRAKDTPGRMVYPLLLEGDPFDITMAAVARLRWNLAKTIAGGDWMNAADGGLTGAYFDYVTYYKKNRELSDEQKEKLTDMFSTAARDEEKFALEYILWIKYESEGIQKLNKVARRIFIHFVPFAVPVRVSLLKQPAFTELIHKDSNRRLKRREELERRIYKLERNGINVGDHFKHAMILYQEAREE